VFFMKNIMNVNKDTMNNLELLLIFV
jgi:hypothetical protein